MKKSLLYLLCLFLFVACKKETDLEKYNKGLIGLWTNSGALIKYYNNAGNQIYEEELKGEGSFINIEFRPNITVNASITDTEYYSSKYDIVNYENKKFIEFYSLALFNTQYFEIQSRTANEMYWKTKFTNITYHDPETDEMGDASYAILTVKLLKN